MISLFRGPGGIHRRIAAELVPLGCACVAGGLVIPLAWTLPTWFGILACVLTGALTWIGASLLLRAVRARPLLKRVYRVALLLHVLFWTTQGVLATVNAPAGAVHAARASAWRAPTAFLAGAAEVPFDLPARTTLAGWGARPRRITLPPFGGIGVLGRLGQRWMAAPLDDGAPTAPLFRRPDPTVAAEVLGVRALVLRPEDEADGPPVAFVRMDLVTSDRKLTEAVAKGLQDLGFRPEGVLLAATHTHSGPGGYSDVPLSGVIGTDHFDAGVFRAVRDTCIAAVRAAHEASRPARIGLVRARDRAQDGSRLLSRNRRKQDLDAIDDRVYALRVDEREGGATIAVLLNYAVHPVLLRRRHMGFHRDFAGALEDAVAAVVPGDPLVLFFNGAQGDISAEPGPEGGGAARGRFLARRFVEQSFAAAWRASTATPQPRLRLRMARTRRTMATPRLVTGAGSREALLDALYAPTWESPAADVGAGVIALPVNAFVWSLGLPELRVGFSFSGALGISVNLEPGVGEDPYDVGAFVFETASQDGTAAERWALLWQPGEATQAVGRAWRRSVADIGIADTLLVGLAGGSTAYFTTEAEFHTEGYEAEATLFGPGAMAAITEALLDALVAAGEAR